MRVGNELLQSVLIDDDLQLMPRGISQMYTQKKLKSKVESFENKPLHGYMYIKKFQKITTLIRNLLENGQLTSL